MRFKKKAVTQIDWAISLAIFLLFLIWFFFFTRPIYDSSNNLESLNNIVIENFLDDVNIEITNSPIIVKSNHSFFNEPIMVENYLRNNISRHYIFNETIEIDQDKFIFLSNLPNHTSTINLFYSTDVSYDSKDKVTDLVQRNDRTSVTNFIAYFENSSLKSASYRGPTKIFSMDLGINGIELSNYSGEYYLGNLFSRYTSDTDAVNLSGYVFAWNPAIHYLIKLNQHISGQNKTVNLFFRLTNYTNYYFDPVNMGKVDYVFDSCEEFDNRRFFDLYDEINHGLSFSIDSDATIKICGNGKKSNLTISFDLVNSTKYRVQFHNGDYSNATKYQDFHETNIGTEISYKGVSESKLLNLSELDPYYLKEKWNFPTSRNFQVEVWNKTTSLFEYSTSSTTSQTNIYSKQIFKYILNQNLEIEPIKVYVRVW